MAVIALDLGGTKLAAAIIAADGRVLCRNVVPMHGRKGKAVGNLICREIEELLRGAQARQIHISGIGVSVPGISYPKSGRVWAPNIPGWTKYPLKRRIENLVRNLQKSAVGGQELPVTIANDRACYVLGEAWRGNARGCKNAIFLAVGTGIGAGIMIDGKVLRGAHDIAGAAGWMALERPFRREYVACGCFEYHASGVGLAKAAREMVPDATKTQGRGKSCAHASALPRPNVLAAPEVFLAFENRDPLAKKIIGRAIQFWGMGAANLISLFNPERIIFGGGVFGPAKKFLPEIRAEAKKWAQPIAMKQVKLLSSALGTDAGLYGAACVALQAGSGSGA